MFIVGNDNGFIVKKDGLCLVERDAVLSQIECGLPSVPFES